MFRAEQREAFDGGCLLSVGPLDLVFQVLARLLPQESRSILVSMFRLDFFFLFNKRNRNVECVRRATMFSPTVQGCFKEIWLFIQMLQIVYRHFAISYPTQFRVVSEVIFFGKDWSTGINDSSPMSSKKKNNKKKNRIEGAKNKVHYGTRSWNITELSNWRWSIRP